MGKESGCNNNVLGDIKWEWDWGGEKNGKDCLFLFFFLFI
jgi:hypothetical protein